MGAGKSRLGRTIARIYRLEAVDSDQAVEKAENQSVRRIIETKGRPCFEEKEREILQKIGRRKGLVVSCGGGTPLDEQNREVLKKGKTVYVKTRPEEILRRLRRRHTRPEIDGKSEAEILSMLRERSLLYEQLADLTVETAGKNEAETAAEIMDSLI